MKACKSWFFIVLFAGFSCIDPVPANIRGNMLSLQDKKETVLGNFSASDERLLRIYIYRENLEFAQLPRATVPNDCRNAYFRESPDPFRPNPNPLPTHPPDDWDP